MAFGLTTGQVLSIGAASVNLIAALTLNFAEHPNKRYTEPVQNIQKTRISEFSAELGSLFIQLQDSIDSHENQPNLAEEELFAIVGQNEITDEDLETLMTLLNKIEKPTSTYKNARRLYTNSQTAFLISAISATFVSILSSIQQPLALTVPLRYVFGGIGVVSLVIGLDRGYRYLRNRRVLDQMIEEMVFVVNDG